MSEGEDKNTPNVRVGPPAIRKFTLVIEGLPPKPKGSLFSVWLSGLGFALIVVGCSGPSQAGLSGIAFKDAFEADESVMIGLIWGVPIAILGLLTGLFSVRLRNGQIGIMLALLSGVWLLIRHNHF